MRELIIAGAGPAGTALAAALARRGVRPLVLEQGHLPRPRACGEFLSPDALHSLAALGLLGAVAQVNPWPVSAFHLVSRSRRQLRLDLSGAAWGVSRAALDLALASAARSAGAEVRFGAPVRAVTPCPGGFCVAVGNERLVARVVVATCGRQARPALRAHLPPPPPRPWVGIRRLYAGIAPGPAAELYLVPGGCVGLAGVEDGHVHCSAMAALPALRRAGGGVERFLAWAAGRNPALARRLAAGRPVSGTEVTIAGVDNALPLQMWSDAVPQTVRAGVMVSPLKGDVAVRMPPLTCDSAFTLLTGDRMAFALRSAEVLAPLLERHLSGDLDAAGLAAAYTAQWTREFAGWLRLARWLQYGLTTPAGAELLLAAGRWSPNWVKRALLSTRGPMAPTPPVSPGPPVPPTPSQATRREHT